MFSNERRVIIRGYKFHFEPLKFIDLTDFVSCLLPSRCNDAHDKGNVVSWFEPLLISYVLLTTSLMNKVYVRVISGGHPRMNSCKDVCP